MPNPIPRPIPRPILIVITVGTERRHYRIAANGWRGRKEVDLALRSLMNRVSDPNSSLEGLTVSRKPAELLDPHTPIPHIEHTEPGGLALDLILAKTKSGSGGRVPEIWQLALLSVERLQARGITDDGIEALNLFLADYGFGYNDNLHVGMTREDLPTGNDKPWNKEPYFNPDIPIDPPEPFLLFREGDLPDQPNDDTYIISLATEDLLLGIGLTLADVMLVREYLAKYELQFGTTVEELPDDDDRPWLHPEFQHQITKVIRSLLLDKEHGLLRILTIAALREEEEQFG